ncbi:hypothetical protein, partial [Nocardia abscessus]|uniref:hypothetical protein n=1 Tax=Nocardia abscessus TaxID=120957 RepID=UPI002458D45E
AGIAGWWMVRNARSGDEAKLAEARAMWRPAARAGIVVMIVSLAGLVSAPPPPPAAPNAGPERESRVTRLVRPGYPERRAAA